MNFKKIISSVLSIALLSTTLSACGNNNGTTNNSGEKQQITVWTSGSENVKTSWEKLAAGFNANEEYNQGKYQMNLQHVSSGTGATSLSDRVISQYKSGQENSEFDLIEVNGGEFEIYTKEGGEDIFQKIDNNKLKNSDRNISSQLATGGDYQVPYRGTTVVLAYNEDMVKNPPKTAEELYKWIEENDGQFAYCTPGTGGSGDSFVATAIYNKLPEEALHSSDEKWKDDWDEGFDLLKELHPHLYQSGGKVVYPHKNQGSLDLLANQQIAMTPAWVDMLISQLQQGTLPESIKMTQIDPGFTGSLVNLAIPGNTKNADGAYAIIDYILSDEAQSILLDEMGAFPVVDMTGLTSKNKDLMSTFDIKNFRTIDIGELGTDITEKWDKEIGTLN